MAEGGVMARPAIYPVGEIVIQIENQRNQRYLWPPTQDELRGTWSNRNLVGTTMVNSPGLQSLPETPGQRVSINCSSKVCRIYDPIEPEMLAEINAKLKNDPVRPVNVAYGLWPESVHEECDETKLKTWLYYARRAVDAGIAKVVAGDLPSLKEIARLPGKTETEMSNSSADKRRFREDPEYKHYAKTRRGGRGRDDD